MISDRGVEATPAGALDLGGDVFELEARRIDARPTGARRGADERYMVTRLRDIDEGWRTFVAQLAFWLELQQGADRGRCAPDDLLAGIASTPMARA